MKDGIIKGTGNSRYLKSVSDFLTQYPDYQSFAMALIEGTLPVDLNGINANGWSQQGTALSKAKLLTDATATSLGLTADATPNDAFAKANALISSAQTTAQKAANDNKFVHLYSSSGVAISSIVFESNGIDISQYRALILFTNSTRVTMGQVSATLGNYSGIVVFYRLPRAGLADFIAGIAISIGGTTSSKTVALNGNVNGTSDQWNDVASLTMTSGYSDLYGIKA